MNSILIKIMVLSVLMLLVGSLVGWELNNLFMKTKQETSITEKFSQKKNNLGFEKRPIIKNLECKNNFNYSYCSFVVEGNVIITKAKGTSMRPCIDNESYGISILTSDVSVGDFVIYKKSNRYVTHQFIGIDYTKSPPCYMMKGLNTDFSECIDKENIIGREIVIFRDGVKMGIE